MKRLLLMTLLLTGCGGKKYTQVSVPLDKEKLLLVVHYGLPDLKITNYDEIKGSLVHDIKQFGDYEFLVVLNQVKTQFGALDSRYYDHYISHEWKVLV